MENLVIPTISRGFQWGKTSCDNGCSPEKK